MVFQSVSRPNPPRSGTGRAPTAAVTNNIKMHRFRPVALNEGWRQD